MSTDSNLLGWIEPPEHGLSELQAKIARREARRKAVAGMAAAVLVVVSSIAVLRDGGKSTAPTDREWKAAIAANEKRLRVINGAALELSPADAETRIYLVSTIPEPLLPESG